MRLAISGSACQGKSTLINDMITAWPMYKRSAESYRDVIKAENIPLNEKVTKDGQWRILNCLLNDIKATSKNDNVIFDRCPLDNLVHSLWANHKGTSDIDDDFIKECIPLVHEAMHSLDIIFFTPITKLSPIQVEERDTRSANKEFISEIDNIFKAISYQYAKTGESPFFPKEDRPPIIEVFGDRDTRIAMIKFYIDQNGEIVSDETSVLSNENIDLMEKLILDQQDAYQAQLEEEKFKSNIIKAKHLPDRN
jgi:predicted ATPase